MWNPPGEAWVFVCASALSAFVAILLRTQDPGSDHQLTSRITLAALSLHGIGLLQALIPSALFVYIQWACSIPPLWWLLSQLVATLPPGSTCVTTASIRRCALIELGAAATGLAVAVATDLTPVRTAVGVVGVTLLCRELVVNVAPSLPAVLLRCITSATGASSDSLGNANGGSGSSSSGGDPRRSLDAAPAPSGLSPSSQGGAGGAKAAGRSRSGSGRPHSVSGAVGGGGSPGNGGGSGTGSSGGAGTGTGGVAGTGSGGVSSEQQLALPSQLQAVTCVFAACKLLQAVAAAAVGATLNGGATAGGIPVLASALWRLSTTAVLYGLPVAMGTYYGMVRYAASMLVVTTRAGSGTGGVLRVRSLGALVDEQQPQQQQQQQQQDTNSGGLLSCLWSAWRGASGGGSRAGGGGGSGGGSELQSPQPHLRRLVSSGDCGGSDSEGFVPQALLPQRLLEVGDLYRITESSDHSSNSGEDGSWRLTDLSLHQLLYMARTTFTPPGKGGSSRASLDLLWQQQQQQQQQHNRGGSLSGMLAAGPAGSPPPGGWGPGSERGRGQAPREDKGVQADPGVLLPGPGGTEPEPARPASTRRSSAHGSSTKERGVQCELLPPQGDGEGEDAQGETRVVIKEVPVEVRVEVPVPAPAAAAGGGSWQELVQALREHSSDIAHDMKNPLNGVLALSQNVLQGTFGELPQPASDQLGVVRACAYHLLNMINQLRDCLRTLHEGDPELNAGRVQLSNAVEEVLKRMSPMVGSRLSITEEQDPSLLVYADDSRLYQTVHTVLANAFKYTRRGGVTIETSTSADTSTVTLRVSDTGPGFSAEQLDKFNSPLTGSPQEQMGLGLTLVKRLMVLMGGMMRLGNKEPSGAWVELVFRTRGDVQPLCPAATAAAQPPPAAVAAAPVQAAAAPSAPPAASTAAGAAAAAAAAGATTAAAAAKEVPRKTRRSIVGSDRLDERLAGNSSDDTTVGGGRSAVLRSPSVIGGGVADFATGAGDDEVLARGDQPVRVLIVDDDPVNLTILEELLRSEGYDVLNAASGTEALETYLTSDPQPKLVLLDVTLPDLSGHEVCLKMRSLTPGVPPPIIMISGKASTKDVIKGLQAGACDYITKPFQPQEVMARVETQLRMFMGEVAQLQAEAERNMSLLRQVLPPHILTGLRGGTRVLVEKFPDVALLCADVVGFSSLAATADTPDCILMLNRLFSTFDALTDQMGVHKMDCHSDTYVAAVGHMPQDKHMSSVMQIKTVLALAREMLAALDSLPYPDTLGKMQIRIGVHVGAIHGGIIGVKYPRYSLFGGTLRLVQGLQATALPNTIHVSEAVFNRVRAAGGEAFVPYTTCSVQSLGIIRTFLLVPPTGPDGSTYGMLDIGKLDQTSVAEYLRASSGSGANGASGLTVLSCSLGAPGSPLHSGPSLPHAQSLAHAGLSTQSSMSGGGVGAGTGGGRSPGAGSFGGGLALGRLSVAGSGMAGGGRRSGTNGPEGVGEVPGAVAGGESAGGRSSSASGGGGGSGGFKIIPVITDRRLGDGAGGGSTAVHHGRAESMAESDASAFAVTLAQVAPAGEHHLPGGLLVGTLGSERAASSNDSGAAITPTAAANVLSMAALAGSDATNATTGGAAAGGGHMHDALLGSLGSAGGSNSGEGVHQGSVFSLLHGRVGAVQYGSERHGSRVSDGSLVQDLMPIAGQGQGQGQGQAVPAASPVAVAGPGVPAVPAAAGAAAAASVARVPPSGSSRGGSRPGSKAPSRRESFRAASASPLATSVMQQQLLTALQLQQQILQLQQQQQQQQQEQLVGATGATGVLTSAVPVNLSVEGGVVPSGSGSNGGGPRSSSAPQLPGCVEDAFELPDGFSPYGNTQETAGLPHLVGESSGVSAADTGGGGAYGSSASEPLSKVPSDMAAAVMRRMGAVPPPKSASVGGAMLAGGNGSHIASFDRSGSIGASSNFSASGSFAGSTSGGAAIAAAASSTIGGRLLSSLAVMSPAQLAAQGQVYPFSGGTGTSLTSPGSMPAFPGTSGGGGGAGVPSDAYAGLSEETRARLARLKTSSKVNLNPDANPSPRHHPPPAPSRTGLSSPSGGTGASPAALNLRIYTNPLGFSASEASAAAISGAASPTFVHSMSNTPVVHGSGAQLLQPLAGPVEELLVRLGLQHYVRGVAASGVGSLTDLAALGDSELRRAGLLSARSRQLVQEELQQLGYR